MRLTSAGCPAGSFSPPQPTGSARRLATTKIPRGGRSGVRATDKAPRGGEPGAELPGNPDPGVGDAAKARVGFARGGLQAALRVVVHRVDCVEADEREAEQPLDLGERSHEPFALR